jgi:hypothetical protein
LTMTRQINVNKNYARPIAAINVSMCCYYYDDCCYFCIVFFVCPVNSDKRVRRPSKIELLYLDGQHSVRIIDTSFSKLTL